MAQRMVFLYTGLDDNGVAYPKYPDATISSFTKATEFVLTHANYDGYLKTGNSSKLNDYQNDLVSLMQQIKRLTGKKVWLGLPRVPKPTGTAAIVLSTYQNYAVQLKNIASSLKQKVGTTDFNSYVQGFYMNDEHVLNENDANGVQVNPSNLLAHPQIYMYNNVSVYVRGSTINKKLIWAPYYGHGGNYSKTIQSIQYIANTINIFEYVMLQPHHYFQTSADIKKNLEAIRTSMRYQNVYSRDAKGVISNTVPRGAGITTKIGCQMEVDQRYHIGRTDARFTTTSDPDYATAAQLKTRYKDYTDCFGATVSGSPSYTKAGAHLSYYCGPYYSGTSPTDFGSLISLINTFYT